MKNQPFLLAVLLILLLSEEMFSQEVIFEKLYPTISSEFYGVNETNPGEYIAVGRKIINWPETRLQILKLDESGEIIWNKVFDQEGFLSNIKPLSNGQFIVVGKTNDPNSEPNAYLAKIDNDGTVLWEKKFGEDGVDSFSFVEKTNDGGFIAVGTKVNAIGNQSSGFVVKTDASGNEIWSYSFDSTQEDRSACTGLIETANGDFVITGFNSSNAQGGFIIKVSDTGNLIWEQYYPQSRFASIIKSIDNQYLVCGGNRVNGVYQSYLAKLDTEGNVIWGNSGGVSGDGFSKLIQVAEGDIFLCGVNYSLNSGYEGDAYVAKLDEEGNIIWQETFVGGELDYFSDFIVTSDAKLLLGGAMNDVSLLVKFEANIFLSTDEKTFISTKKIAIEPNPSTGHVRIKNSSIGKDLGMEIYSVNGQLINSLELKANQSEISTEILNSGMYFIKAFNKDGYILSDFFIVEK